MGLLSGKPVQRRMPPGDTTYRYAPHLIPVRVLPAAAPAPAPKAEEKKEAPKAEAKKEEPKKAEVKV